MQKPKRLLCCDKTFKTVEQLKTHKERVHGENLPIWCRGIMGGCVNCGGCI